VSVVVIGFNGPPSSVDNQDFATIIDGLLRRPLMYLHADQIRELKAKEKHSGLTEVDKIYISDIWNKFRSLPEARVEEGQSEEPGGAVAEQTLDPTSAVLGDVVAGDRRNAGVAATPLPLWC